MEEKEQKILDFMKNEDYVPMKAKEIAMLMRVPKMSIITFRDNRKARIRIKDSEE